MTFHRTGGPGTSVRLVWPFLQVTKPRGDVLRRIRDKLGITQEQLQDPETRVSLHLVARLLADAITHSGERDLGLIAASWVDSAHLGLYEYIARSSETLLDVVRDTQRYLPLFGDGAGHTLERDGDRMIGRFWLAPGLVIHEAAYEFVVALSVLAARRFSGDPGRAPLEVHFMHRRPLSIARHEALFRCPVYFGAEQTQVVMSARTLQRRLPGADPVLADLLKRQARSAIEQLPHDERLANRVRALLSDSRELRGATAQGIARRLGLSTRTMTRLLGEEGTHFRALLGEARMHAAQRELTQGTQPISEIAARVGYANSQAFHRAYKRWTGNTVAAARRQAQRSARR